MKLSVAADRNFLQNAMIHLGDASCNPDPPSRYAWAERAKTAGYPERFAQEALGHNSKAVHRAYAKKAKVELPSLGEYERRRAKFIGLRVEPPALVVAK